MKIIVAKEHAHLEKRVALVPESVRRLTAAGNEVFVEQGAGITANASDIQYTEAGAKTFSDWREIGGEGLNRDRDGPR